MLANPFVLALIISIVLNMSFFILAYQLKTDKFTDFTYGLTFIILTLLFLFKNNKLKEVPNWVFDEEYSVVNLNSNELTEIDERFSKMDNLEVLHLSENNISVFKDFLLEKRNLMGLHLNNCNIKEIPEDGWDKTYLYDFGIDGNPLSETKEGEKLISDIQQCLIDKISKIYLDY